MVIDDADTASREVTASFERVLPVECLTASDRRIVPMLNTGLAYASGNVVAMTDDDARPHPSWLRRLLEPYVDPRVGGVGGRDLMDEPGSDDAAPTETVGRLRWFGRPVYGHHRGTGTARDVDVLKGVSFSLRRELWSLDEALRGHGMQLHWELDLCLRARREGWRLVYDPTILVDHPRAPRVDEDQRESFTHDAVRDDVHNEFYAILKWLPGWRRAVALVYGFAVGTRVAPGLLLALERIVREGDPGAVVRRSRAAAVGRALAVRSLMRFLRRRRAPG